MALTKAFYNAVQSGDILSVRIMMQDSLLVDPTFVDFDAMEKAAASMVGLYDEHDGKELVQDRNLWNDNYMDRVMVKVLSNFSHERLDHLKEVVRYLRPVTKITDSKQESTNHNNNNCTHQSSYEEGKRRCQERGDYLGAKIGGVGGAAIVGGIVYGAGAPVLGVIGGITAGAVVGGFVGEFVASHIGNGGKR